MFWGLIIEPNKRYTQIVEKSFHVSMASLDLTTADDNLVQVMLCYDNRNYLLCSLIKNATWQVPLDLNFQEGTKIAFTCNGHGHVHLTGYLIPDEDLDLDELEEEEDDEEAPQLVDKQSKRKAKDSLSHKKNAKRPRQEPEAESSDEEDIELDGLNEESETDDLEEGDELNQVEEEDSEEDEDEEEDEEDEEEKVVKLQQKDKKNKRQQQQQQQQQKKLLNGKEAKHEQQQKQQKKSKEEQRQSNDKNVQNDQKKRIVEGGVQVEELKVGNGTPAKAGKFVSVYYVGRLKNGKKFDSTMQGEGFKFRLGKGEVIKGWDVGIAGMRVGGKRRVTIPPAMAYGAKGSPPVIPGNSTLVFEVELRNVH
ncbi:FK506-binding protein 39kD isoform X2 [Colletes latitarsis]|uniref:FK506-binding protein 39kD isoform X2 n=1 Tax=Colletes latitarsis TaxID=2605962 RepID=UPI00403698BA